jgi:serine/threonine protein kinase
MLKKGIVLESIFDEYTIIEQIGQGGNATVFKANNTDNEIYAIKVIDRNKANKKSIKRFKNEIYFCLKNEHPNIIKVLDYGKYINGNLNCIFYVMPYYESTLKGIIKESIKPEIIIDIYMKILSGIEFAHKNKVWHRDIKPENILYSKSTKEIVIADFGIAHFYENQIKTIVETKITERLANFLYAAPEQKTDTQLVNGRADIYALGLILNEMFTKKIIHGTNYIKIGDIDSNYSYLDDLVERLIIQKPEDRLYPVRIIKTELMINSSIASKNIELEKIINTEIFKEDANDTFTEPEIIDMNYADGNLNIFLDKITPDLWNQLLVSGRYSHSHSSHYSPRTFNAGICKEKKSTYFSAVLQEKDNHLVESIYTSFKSWIPDYTK